tara:strand:+ start:39 stop:308 length:270 start_codon:yes stop_codon:yes gene_type:complete
MCSLLNIGYDIFFYSLFAWIILSWIQVPYDHPVGQVKSLLDRYFEKLLNPLRRRIPPLRIGMTGLDLSPLILIFGLQIIFPIVRGFLGC